MKQSLALLIGLAVGACGGGGSTSGPSSNEPATANPVPGAPRTVSYATGPGGCLGRHNADSEVSYLLGDRPAKYLAWHCADHDQHELRRVRLSLVYDYTQQCYILDTTVVDFAHCSATLPPLPNPATFSLRIADFAVTPGRNAQGQPGFSYVAVIENTGTVPAFDVTYRVAIDQGSGGNAGNIEVIDAGGRSETRRADVYGAAASGSRFTLDLSIEDAVGRIVAARRAIVDIP